VNYVSKGLTFCGQSARKVAPKKLEATRRFFPRIVSNSIHVSKDVQDRAKVPCLVPQGQVSQQLYTPRSACSSNATHHRMSQPMQFATVKQWTCKANSCSRCKVKGDSHVPRQKSEIKVRQRCVS
jgi:hypothetical protein